MADDLAKQSKEDRIRAKRQAAIVDQVLGAIRDNMTNLSAAQLQYSGN